MFDNISVQEAVRKAIQVEKNAMDFYRAGSELMKDPDAKRVFGVLAGEEREHANQFYRKYTGSDIPSFDSFMDTPPEQGSDWMASLKKIAGEGFNEQKALELAMESEQKLEKTLRETAARIPDPDVRSVFELNAQETHRHYEVIESEYARVMGMVHESDMDTFVRE